jgi:endonuclease/exonuclease/phosphatase family metal-dependent hydrolase
LGLAWRAVSLERKVAGWVVAILCFILFQLLKCTCAPAQSRFATFNIENYPKSDVQEAAALALVRSMGTTAVALQEITDPGRLRRAAKIELGSSWDLVATERPHQRVALLFDGNSWQLVSSRTIPDTEVYAGAKPALEAELVADDATRVRFFVVHLKAGGDGGGVRAAQLRALAPRVASAVGAGDTVLVAGDFNATGPADLDSIATFARDTGLDHASKDVPCTAYWNRRDGCLGVALDHVLSSRPTRVEAMGPCRDEGCDQKPSCPVFREQVSDHCPVAFAL